jgi:L-ascorbate metabolism protein UlaG (beta-lactamase superfamily)
LGVLLAFVMIVGTPTPARAQGKGKVEILWLGQSAIRLTTPGGKVILIDPFIAQNPKTPAEWKNLDKLGKLDLILVTHAHGDHLGDGPVLAVKQQVPLIGPAGLDQTLQVLGALPEKLAPRLNKGGTITPFPGIAITQVKANHSSELLWKDSKTGQASVLYGGEPIGFIVKLENGFTIYDTGDTGLFTDMKFIAEKYKPDLVMLPIGGHFTMDPKDAAYATKYWLKPRYALPFRYGTFPALKGTPAACIKAPGKTKTKVFPIRPGETITF